MRTTGLAGARERVTRGEGLLAPGGPGTRPPSLPRTRQKRAVLSEGPGQSAGPAPSAGDAVTLDGHRSWRSGRGGGRRGSGPPSGPGVPFAGGQAPAGLCGHGRAVSRPRTAGLTAGAAHVTGEVPPRSPSSTARSPRCFSGDRGKGSPESQAFWACVLTRLRQCESLPGLSWRPETFAQRVTCCGLLAETRATALLGCGPNGERADPGERRGLRAACPSPCGRQWGRGLSWGGTPRLDARPSQGLRCRGLRA